MFLYEKCQYTLNRIIISISLYTVLLNFGQIVNILSVKKIVEGPLRGNWKGNPMNDIWEIKTRTISIVLAWMYTLGLVKWIQSVFACLRYAKFGIVMLHYGLFCLTRKNLTNCFKELFLSLFRYKILNCFHWIVDVFVHFYIRTYAHTRLECILYVHECECILYKYFF